MTRYWKLLLPEYIFSWPVFVPTYVWALLIHFTDVIINKPGNYLPRFLIITSLHLLLFACLYIYKIMILDRTKSNFVPFLLLVGVIVLGLCRGFLLQYSMFLLDYANIADYWIRMQSSVLNVTISLIISLVAYVSSQRRNMLFRELLIESDRLKLLKDSTLRSTALEYLDKVEKEIVTRINQLKFQQDGALNSIREIIENLVQPVSRNIENELLTWSPPIAKNVTMKIKWLRVIKESLRPSQISFLLVPITLVILGLPIILAFGELEDIVVEVSKILFVGIGLGFIVKRAYGTRNGNVLEYFLVTFTIGLAMGATSLGLTENYLEGSDFFYQAIVFYFVIASVFAVLNNAERERKKINIDLIETIKELEWQVARRREKYRVGYQRFARFLHGPVQASLTAAFIELQPLVQQPEKFSSKLSNCVDDLLALMSNTNKMTFTSDDIKSIIEKMKVTWLNISDIKLIAREEILNLIDSDEFCKTTLVEVIPELTFNSIKHGEASYIEVRLDSVGLDRIRVEIIDNGHPGKESTSFGLGTRILNESAISWHRQQSDAGTITTADFAFKRLETSTPIVS